ncbi:TOBE domain-containing protein [Rubellimicrobium mesophilum]|uniref:TOBE domain-containing protein n=1 Tax=Rubellimicrobium mesophilum TaxID=1123067 RepID=UPI001FE0A1E6|nr:TOBE domain-containing protein [Rubellimicrobium mesophilum]
MRYSLRPEDVRVGEGLEGRVADGVPTSAETHLVIEVAGSEVTVIAKGRLSPRSGDQVRLTLESSRGQLFDSGSGLRLQCPEAGW